MSRFSEMIMAAKTSSSGRVDRVSKIDLSVKLDEDSVDDEDEEMELGGSVKDEEACSPSGHENRPVLELATNKGGTASERSTVEDDVDSPPSSPAAGGLSASAATQLKNEVRNRTAENFVYVLRMVELMVVASECNQVFGARIEIARLREENDRYRSILTQLSSEYYNLQMHMVSSMQRRGDSTQQVKRKIFHSVTISDRNRLAIVVLTEYCSGASVLLHLKEKSCCERVQRLRPSRRRVGHAP